MPPQIDISGQSDWKRAHVEQFVIDCCHLTGEGFAVELYGRYCDWMALIRGVRPWSYLRWLAAMDQVAVREYRYPDGKRMAVYVGIS